MKFEKETETKIHNKRERERGMTMGSSEVDKKVTGKLFQVQGQNILLHAFLSFKSISFFFLRLTFQLWNFLVITGHWTGIPATCFLEMEWYKHENQLRLQKVVFSLNEMEIQPKKDNKVNSVSDVFLNLGNNEKWLLFREKIRHKKSIPSHWHVGTWYTRVTWC